MRASSRLNFLSILMVSIGGSSINEMLDEMCEEFEISDINNKKADLRALDLQESAMADESLHSDLEPYERRYDIEEHEAGGMYDVGWSQAVLSGQQQVIREGVAVRDELVL